MRKTRSIKWTVYLEADWLMEILEEGCAEISDLRN